MRLAMAVSAKADHDIQSHIRRQPSRTSQDIAWQPYPLAQRPLSLELVEFARKENLICAGGLKSLVPRAPVVLVHFSG